jgi:hypothetical protein
MHSHHTLEYLAREKNREALAASRTARQLREAQAGPGDPLASHYHFRLSAPAYRKQEAALERERLARLVRQPARGQGLLARLTGALRRLFLRPASS